MLVLFFLLCISTVIGEFVYTGCPADLEAYLGCNKTVHINVTTNNVEEDCSNYGYSVLLTNSANTQSKVIPANIIQIPTKCKISVTFFVEDRSISSVSFQVHNQTGGSINTCTNALTVYENAPRVTEGYFEIKRYNSSRVTVTLISKLVNPDCPISHPTSVAVSMTCNDASVYNNHTVSVSPDGNEVIMTALQAPIDNECNGVYTWKNPDYDAPAISYNFSTNQLHSCDISIITNEIIHYTCEYINDSTLDGCEVVLKSSKYSYNVLLVIVVIIVIQSTRSKTKLRKKKKGRNSKVYPLFSTIDGRPIQQDMNNFNNGNKIGDLKKEILSSKIYDEYMAISFDGRGLFHHSHRHGVTIIIPEGAVQGPATLQFGATLLLTDFKCEDCFEPVSPFVWIHTDKALLKPAELYISHYAKADTIEDKRKLCPLTRGHGENDVFKVNNTMDVDISETLVKATATHFCSICLAGKSVSKKYILLNAKRELDNGAIWTDICVLYSVTCLQEFRKNHEDFDVIHKQFIQSPFEEMKFKVVVPESCGWKWSFREIGLDCIREEDVDIYKLLDSTPDTITDKEIKMFSEYQKEGLYPQCIKWKFSPNPFSRTCEANISVVGKNQSFSIPIELGGIIVRSLTLTSATSNDSGYDVQCYEDSAGKHSSTDSFIINMMTFLKSKLTTDYYEFGWCLGLCMDEIDKIKQDSGHDTGDATREILLLWRKTASDLSHTAIAKALAGCGYHLLSTVVNSYYERCQTSDSGNINELDVFKYLSNSIFHTQDYKLMGQEPEMSDLNNLLRKISPKLEIFGTQLGFEPYVMEILKRNNPTDCQLCFQDLLNEWKKQRPSSFTWLTVMAILYSDCFQEYKLVENIYHHIKNTNSITIENNSIKETVV